MSNERELEPICPACGSADLKSLGYNYDLAKVFYECSDCEAQGDAEYFEPDEVFDVVTFDQFDDSYTHCVEGGIPWDKAVALAESLFATGKYYGVEIITCDPDNMEPIVWIKTITHD